MKHRHRTSAGAKAAVVVLLAALLLAGGAKTFAAQERVVVSVNMTRQPQNDMAALKATQMRAASSWSTKPKLEPVGVPASEVEEVTPPAEKHLTKRAGVFDGPSGKETWYDRDMTKVIAAMRKKGFSEEEYPYWIREDGVKMLGRFVMVAACYDLHPLGWAVETSLGTGIVCDTGPFAETDPYQVDIAVSWKTKTTSKTDNNSSGEMTERTAKNE